MGHAHHPAKLAAPALLRRADSLPPVWRGPFAARSTQAYRGIGRLLVVVLLAGVASGCSFYTAGRTLSEYPIETLECFPECPYYTEPITLRHPVAGTLVECGPYPHALYSSMAAVYRLERQQCVERYQRQGYMRLARAEVKRGR